MRRARGKRQTVSRGRSVAMLALIVAMSSCDDGESGEAGVMPGGGGGGAVEAPAEEESSSVSEGEAYLGVIIAPERVDAAAHAEGVVLAVSVQVGDVVTEGEEVARVGILDSAHRDLVRELGAALRQREVVRQEVRRAELELGEATREYEARCELQADTAATDAEVRYWLHRKRLAGADLDIACAGLEVAEQRVWNLEEQFSPQPVRAPVGGIVVQRYVEPGTVVVRGARIVAVANYEDLAIRFAIPPGGVVPELARGDGVVGCVEGADQVAMSASIVRILPGFDAALGVVAEAEINAGSLPEARRVVGRPVRVRIAED